MPKTTLEIIHLLGGPTAAGKFFGVQPPSVAGWLKSGVIPEGRLLRRAAKLEIALPGKFSRRDQWPDEYPEIWPELVETSSPGDASVWNGQERRSVVAHGVDPADGRRETDRTGAFPEIQII